MMIKVQPEMWHSGNPGLLYETSDIWRCISTKCATQSYSYTKTMGRKCVELEKVSEQIPSIYYAIYIQNLTLLLVRTSPSMTKRHSLCMITGPFSPHQS